MFYFMTFGMAIAVGITVVFIYFDTCMYITEFVCACRFHFQIQPNDTYDIRTGS